MRPMSVGETACLRATDPAAVVDVPHFCNEQGHILRNTEENGDETLYFVEKA